MTPQLAASSIGPRGSAVWAMVMALALGPTGPAQGHSDAATSTAEQPRPDWPTTGESVRDLQPLDDLMQGFVQEHGIPGATLAVTLKGNLVYARGFGWADALEEQPVQPDTLFRIASISKPITAVAVLQLVEQGKLKLDQPFWPILDPDGARPWEDKRVHTITIRQLLQHRGGWDRARAFDPMFRSHWIANTVDVPHPADKHAILEFMRGSPLQFDPGTDYAYSNFGYMLLGLVIETVTGKAYEQHVQQELLGPLGIRTMRIGSSLPDKRAQGETHYFGPPRRVPSVFDPDAAIRVPFPDGGFHLEAMDAHGGWIASGVDLVRFASSVDPTGPCVLQPESLAAMLAHPERPPSEHKAGVHYGCGWSVRTHERRKTPNIWHSGSLPGTATLLVSRHDDFTWAVLFNTRRAPEGQNLTRMIDPLVHRAVNQVKRWPLGDRFRDFGHVK